MLTNSGIEEEAPMATLQILGHTYQIRNDNKVEREHSAAGQTCAATLEITLDPLAPTTRYEEAFLHEIIEALNFHHDLQLEHKVLSALAEGLYAVLQRNGLKTDWATRLRIEA